MKKDWVLSENASYKIVALLITLILWVIILGSKEDSVVKRVPTNYLLPRGMVITGNVPQAVDFRFTGPRLPLKRFSETVEPLTIDLSSQMEGIASFRIHPDNIDVPPSVRVVSVSPALITATLERVLTVKIPVEVRTRGTLPKGKKLVHLSADPSTFEISAPRSVAEKVKTVATESVDLTSITESTVVTVNILSEAGFIKKEGASEVKVTVEVR